MEESSLISLSNDKPKPQEPQTNQGLPAESINDDGSNRGNHDLEQNLEEKKIKYPISTLFIIANEFCERFSYYGMRTVLTLYFRDGLGYNEDLSTVIYHLFTMLCYFTPVLGAILADTWAGKFNTILSLSIVYVIGEIILTISAIPNTLPQEAFSLIGLFIIALGTGGIKPCVSAFGGDQFITPQQNRQLEAFFSVFYFAINAGSLISTYLTPVLREEKCFGMKSCFPLAFGVPAILMVVAVAVFICGKPLYKMKKPEGNIMLDVAKCMGHALKRKFKSKKGEKHDHWLEFASDRYDKQLIEDIKRVLSVLVIFLPIPIFWALYDQQGSRWTFQATRMNGGFGYDNWSLEPDQMQIVNPLLILIMVPIFESLIYPCFSKCNLLTPLQRMISGCFIAGIAFIISGILELQLEPTYPKIPGLDLSQLDFYNTFPCSVNLHYVVDGNVVDIGKLNPTDRFKFGKDPDFIKAGLYNISAELEMDGQGLCGGLNVTRNNWVGEIEAPSNAAFSVIVTLQDTQLFLKRMDSAVPLDKSVEGLPRVGFILNMVDDDTPFTNITMTQGSKVYTFLVNSSTSQGDHVIQTEVQEVEIGTYQVSIPMRKNSLNESLTVTGTVKTLFGGCYVGVIQRSFNDSLHDLTLLNFQVTSENSIHMLWLIPQYFVMTAAEVLVSVTGLQFAYTQAPTTMRSLLQAMWLLTVAFGNLIVIIVAEAKVLPKQSDEFFLFAGLMGIDMILFIILAVRYNYVEPATEENVPLKVADQDSKTKDDFL